MCLNLPPRPGHSLRFGHTLRWQVMMGMTPYDTQYTPQHGGCDAQPHTYQHEDCQGQAHVCLLLSGQRAVSQGSPYRHFISLACPL